MPFPTPSLSLPTCSVFSDLCPHKKWLNYLKNCSYIHPLAVKIKNECEIFNKKLNMHVKSTFWNVATLEVLFGWCSFIKSMFCLNISRQWKVTEGIKLQLNFSFCLYGGKISLPVSIRLLSHSTRSYSAMKRYLFLFR